MTVQEQTIVKSSATSFVTPPPHARSHVVEVAKLIDVTTCIGCKACQVGCSEWNDIRTTPQECVGVYDNPIDLNAEQWTVMRFQEVEENDRLEWLIRKDGCMHCTEPGCLKACPSPGAIIKYSNGIVDFQSDKCIGCGYCIAGCPFNIPRMNPKDNRVYKCTLCVDRVNVGQEPACVKTCPTGAIRFGSKEEMLHYGEERVKELKSRGYENAGIYDPEGVGGTHVIYVLHHADKPELYSGLPKNPSVDLSVELWKDLLKPVAAVAMGGLLLAEVAHYVSVGPNVEEDVDDHFEKFEQEDREIAERKAQKKREKEEKKAQKQREKEQKKASKGDK
ncbi:formate dehydrogenase subunit beta [Lonepinella sp. MS14437]|uniref:formate dehydrogenase subunit beta n=1 Tax=unclassified Lonepinella TaxID=2642006 RepID=UPI0036D9356B